MTAGSSKAVILSVLCQTALSALEGLSVFHRLNDIKRLQDSGTTAEKEHADDFPPNLPRNNSVTKIDWLQ